MVAMRKVLDARLLATCPVCGSRKGLKCVEINVPRLRGGTLAQFRKTLKQREPHDSRIARSDVIAKFCMAVALIATAIGTETAPPKKRKSRAA